MSIGDYFLKQKITDNFWTVTYTTEIHKNGYNYIQKSKTICCILLFKYFSLKIYINLQGIKRNYIKEKDKRNTEWDYKSDSEKLFK